MSVEAISWALNLAPVPADRGGQPSSACKFVLVGLANHAGPDGTGAFPSVATLVRYTGLAERTVRTCLDRLAASVGRDRGQVQRPGDRLDAHRPPPDRSVARPVAPSSWKRGQDAGPASSSYSRCARLGADRRGGPGPSAVEAVVSFLVSFT